MRCIIVVLLMLSMPAGCTSPATVPGSPGWQVSPAYYNNPTLLAVRDHLVVWETVVDVVDDYFPKIEREEPVRLMGDILTEGRLDTFPIVGATLLEPWRRDSVGTDARLESTLQSIRRRAVVRVIPDQHGFLVDVSVFKELEDLPRPVHSTVGDTTFRYDGSLSGVVSPVTSQPVSKGWISLGRDTALEQRILQHLLARVGAAPMR